MFTLPFILAAGSLPLISGAPVPSSLFSKSVDTASSHSLNGRSSNLYSSVFGGDGLVSDGWPSLTEWISSFDDMFENNREIMRSSCAQWNVPNNSDEEINHIKNGINSVAQSSSIDPRFILAIVMQESNGCVRVPTTNYGVNNPGLMQSHDGTGSCNDGTNVQSPCPESQILQMVKDGTEGTAAGDGLQQCLAQEGGSGVTAYYKAARCYNSGSVAASGNLGQGIATHCYVSDIANRLLGWSLGTSHCNDGSVGSLTGSSWSPSGSSSGSSSAAPEPSATSEPVPTVSVTETPTVAPQTPTASPAAPTSTETVVPVPTTTPAAASTAEPTPSASSTAAPVYPYAISTCQQYDTIVAGDYCDKVDAQDGITLAQLQSWNPGLDSVCSDLWKGYRYCVKA